VRDETPQTPWYAIEADETLKALDSATDGLRSDEAAKRLVEVGPNSLEAEEETGPLQLLLRQVRNPLIYLLAGAAVLSLLVGHGVDAAVIAGVILLNSLLGFFQEWRAEGALSALREMAAPHARVLRDGRPFEIDAADVVPGDVLLLETGDQAAADARLLSADDLHLDESALTGESEPVAKRRERVEEGTPLADRKNMLWMSTSVTGGRGRAVVVATGMRTEMGRIAGQVRSTQREETPLQKRMHKLGLVLGAGGIGLAAVVFVLGVLRGYSTVEMLMFAVAAAVSAIPEGLPAVISVTLALGVRRMAQRNAIIRRMTAVETLGSTTVICSDKTGTITKNQMTVRRLWAGGQAFEVSGEGYAPEGELRRPGGEPVTELPDALQRLLRIGALCNNAELKDEGGQWRVDGNPSEGALLVAARKAGVDPDGAARDGARLAEIPFSSGTKYMATLHPAEEGAKRIVFVKGAPERILESCSHVLADGERAPLDEERRRRRS
jgi:Ca2+-transporting ATPase